MCRSGALPLGARAPLHYALQLIRYRTYHPLHQTWGRSTASCQEEWSSMMTKRWESYEEVATYLLRQFAQEFGLDRVEGTQEVVGQRSDTTWEIDAKGVRQGYTGFVSIECRRYTTSKPN